MDTPFQYLSSSEAEQYEADVVVGRPEEGGVQISWVMTSGLVVLGSFPRGKADGIPDSVYVFGIEQAIVLSSGVRLSSGRYQA